MNTLSANTLIEAAKLQANFDDLASGVGDQASNSLELTRRLTIANHISSGGLITGDSYGVNRNASMTSIIAIINGKYVTRNSVSARTYTASKDTYVDIDSAGTLTYTEVSNNAASPALAADSIRIAIVITAAGSIASSANINQGSIVGVLPAASGSYKGLGAFDTRANPIYPTSASRKLVGSAARQDAPTTGAPGGSAVAWNGMNYIPFICKPRTNYRLTFEESIFSGYSGSGRFILIPYLGTSANAYTDQVQEFTGFLNSAGHGICGSMDFNSGSYSGLVYLSLKMDSTGWSGTATLNASATRPATYEIEEIS